MYDQSTRSKRKLYSMEVTWGEDAVHSGKNFFQKAHVPAPLPVCLQTERDGGCYQAHATQQGTCFKVGRILQQITEK